MMKFSDSPLYSSSAGFENWRQDPDPDHITYCKVLQGSLQVPATKIVVSVEEENVAEQ